MRLYASALIIAIMLTVGMEHRAAIAAKAQLSAVQVCPINVVAYVISRHPDNLALVLWSDDEAGLATGSIAVYANGLRYHIPFTDVVAADRRNKTALPTPMVVPFDAAHFESAYVESLEGSSCSIHEPFMQQPEKGDELKAAAWVETLDRAVAARSQTAPAGERAELLTCAEPYVRAAVSHAADGYYPRGITTWFGGSIDVTLALAADGSVTALRIDDAKTRDNAYNIAAVRAVAQSKFTPEIYRCQPVSAIFRYIVSFGKNYVY